MSPWWTASYIVCFASFSLLYWAHWKLRKEVRELRADLVDTGMTFKVLGEHVATCTCRKCKSQLGNFVSARIDEHEVRDEAETLRELWNAAYDQVALHHEGQKPNFARGEVKNLRTLKELARQWRDHPDYREAWDRWMWGE